MKLKPGPGYRFLEAGERTQKCDEALFYGMWLPAKCGVSVCVGHERLYRRPVGESEASSLHIPRHIAAAIMDAVGWMVGEGQTFEDESAGKELMAYIAATYSDLVPEWMEGRE